MDGWITIGTELKTDNFDKQLTKVQRKLQQLKKEEEKLNLKKQSAEASLNPYQNELKELKQLIAESEKLNMTAEQRKYEDSVHQGMLDQINLKYQKQIDNLNNINKKMKQNKSEQELLNSRMEDLNNKLQQQGIGNFLENIGKSTSKAVKQVGKWALAVFGVRAAYGFVRNAVSTLSQYNEKLATDLEYIRFAIASSLEPLIEKIVSLVYRLLNYLNYIAQAWFGVNLFANASADAMNKSAKSAKDMKKSLAGFDEMNVVNSSSANSSNSSAPGMDLSGMQGEIPSWVQWIADNKDLVIAGLMGIAGGILAIKFGLDAIGIMGIGLIMAGLSIAIQGIVDFIKDPSWDNFLTILQGISLVVAGIAVLMGGWIVTLIALGVALVANVIQNWDKVKEILGVVGTWIYDHIIKPVGDFFVNLWNSIKNGAISFWDGTKNVFNTIGNWIYTHIIKPVADFFTGLWNGIVSGVTTAVSTVKNVFNSVVNFFKNIISTIVNLFKNIGTKVGDVIGSTFKNVINSVLSAIENILNFPIKSINKLIDVINAVPGINLGKLGTFNLPRLKSGGIINMPGKGIPIGGAIGGEAGREGVLPLTDSQAMEELGSAIGRYITINLTNNTNLDGRTIARQQSKVQANRNFAMNR